MKLKLGEICSFQSGGTPSKTNADYFSGDIPWITTVALNGQTIGKTAAVDWITEKAIEESAAKIVPAKSIMVGTRVGVGKVAINEIPMSTSQDIISLIGINESLWSKEFLCKFIQSKESYLKSQARGATIKGIKIDVLASLVIPDISFDSQQEIVAVLDKAQSILAARRSQLSALDDLIKARFVELFGDPVLNPLGWNTSTLVKNATLINGRAYKQDELLDTGKYPVLRVGNFFSNRGWYYSNLELEEDKYCEAGDLLYAWSASFGPQIWTGSKVIYHYHIWKVLVGEAYNKQFLCKLLDYQTESLMGDTHGIAMMHLTKSGMEETKFIVPPIELQEKFADFVAQIDKSKFAVQKSLEETQKLFDSLMQQYFG